MTSPTPGGNKPRMPYQPIVDRFDGMNRGRLGEIKVPKQPKLKIQPVVSGQYKSIKKTKEVNKIYKTY